MALYCDSQFGRGQQTKQESPDKRRASLSLPLYDAGSFFSDTDTSSLEGDLQRVNQKIPWGRHYDVFLF